MDINERNREAAIFMLDATRSKVWIQQRKTARNLNGCWALAGGGVDPDEAPSEAAARELGEEAAIARTPVQLAFLRKTQEDKTPTNLWCVFWYAIVLEPGEVPKPNKDLAGPWELFDIGQLRTGELPLCPGIVQMLATLEDYLESLPPTNIAAPYPCALSTVDVAACRYRGGTYEVVLGRKKNAKRWRLPGGFVDCKKDRTFREAAARELGEEVPGCVTAAEFEVICPGIQVDDPRYRRDKDKVFTTLFLLKYVGPDDWRPRGGDDLPEVQWFALEAQMGIPREACSPVILEEDLVREHIPLLKALKERLIGRGFQF